MPKVPTAGVPGGDVWLSVVMPTYNGERYVADALESVRRQWTEGLEVVVVDDGSSDGTVDAVRRFAPGMAMTVIRGPRTGNWVTASNVGLRAATGRFACFLHQDDMWLPGRVTAIRRALDAADAIALLLHDAVFVGPDGARLGTWRCPLREPFTPAEVFCERLIVQNFIAIPSPVFDRGAALASGGMDEELWYTADWDLWLRLGALGPVRFIDGPLAAFRIHRESQTVSRQTHEGERERQMRLVVDRHVARGPWPAAVRARLERVARFSVDLNVAMAAAARGEARSQVHQLVSRFLRLGPGGWARYFRDSRIVERVLPRLRLGLHGRRG